MIKNLSYVVLLGLALESISIPIRAPEGINCSSNFCRDSIFAFYRYQVPGGLAGVSIELIDNKNFYYNAGTDVQQTFSYGKWKIVKDTLVLNSALCRNDIPVTFKEFRNIAENDSLSVGWIKDLNGDVIKDAQVFFNNDTLRSCMPTLDDCKIAKSSAKQIMLTFNNKCSTKWYKVKDTSTTRVEPVVSLTFSLDNYVFLINKKYLIRKEGLYELREKSKKVKGVEKIFLIREGPVLRSMSNK